VPDAHRLTSSFDGTGPVPNWNTGYSGYMLAGATGRLLHDPKGGSFWFDAGAVCLDFAHTGGEGRYAVFETLHEPADLGEWLAQPPLAAAVSVPVTGRELAAARTLRQAIWDSAHACAAQRPLPAGAAAVINRAAAEAPLVPELAGDGPTARWAPPVRAGQALSTLAREMIALLSGPLSARIRECDGDDCPLVFVDLSRPGARRWCAMERCGNRHKLRALRARRAAEP
jgi:predicted RNA-binding Zn ribbon-like protein